MRSFLIISTVKKPFRLLLAQYMTTLMNFVWVLFFCFFFNTNTPRLEHVNTIANLLEVLGSKYKQSGDQARLWDRHGETTARAPYAAR